MFQVFRIHKLFYFALGLILAAFSGCSDSGPETAGATSETTNGIAVVALDGVHKPIPQARVTLYQRPRAASAESPPTANGSHRLKNMKRKCW